LFLKKENEELIEAEASIGWDGRNLLIRIPKDVAQFLGLNEKNRFTKNIKFEIKHDLDGNITKKFDVVDRQAPKKKQKHDK
jgi:hypothetical protein